MKVGGKGTRLPGLNCSAAKSCLTLSKLLNLSEPSSYKMGM